MPSPGRNVASIGPEASVAPAGRSVSDIAASSVRGVDRPKESSLWWDATYPG